jgi:hypothetical protein
LFREIDDLMVRGEAGRLALLSEGLGRGVVAESDCPSATAWVIQYAPSFRAGGAAQLVTVAHAIRPARNAALAAAVLDARVPVRNAAVALVEIDKLRPRLCPEAIPTVWAGFIQIATDFGPREIRSLRDKLIATYGREGEFERRGDQLKHGVRLSQPYDDDGMAVYRLRLDPEDLLARAGAGTADLSGQLLTPETIRKMACDATIIPVVLGSDSEVLDVGRARRLFPPGILRAMWLRDKGCTIAGCGTPPQWGRRPPHRARGPTAGPPA